MHYELYLDSMFLLNLGMNLLLLIMVDHSTCPLPRGTGCCVERESERSAICSLFYGRERLYLNCCSVCCPEHC